MSAIRTAPPPVFQLSMQTKDLSKIDPWEALAWRLGGPGATLGPPERHPIPDPIPIPSRQRVNGTHRVKRTAFCLASSQQLGAGSLCFQRASHTHISLWSELLNIPFVRLKCQGKKRMNGAFLPQQKGALDSAPG